MEHLKDERKVVDCHLVVDLVFLQINAKHTWALSILACVLPVGIWFPNALLRDRIKEVEFAVEELFGEDWSFDWGSVQVAEAEGVGVIGSARATFGEK